MRPITYMPNTMLKYCSAQPPIFSPRRAHDAEHRQQHLRRVPHVIAQRLVPVIEGEDEVKAGQDRDKRRKPPDAPRHTPAESGGRNAVKGEQHPDIAIKRVNHAAPVAEGERGQGGIAVAPP
ncbi:MAG: hypothetical protein PSY14_11440 [bacterium]|nr:hypothetical protein [bacterium]